MHNLSFKISTESHTLIPFKIFIESPTAKMHAKFMTTFQIVPMKKNLQNFHTKFQWRASNTKKIHVKFSSSLQKNVRKISKDSTFKKIMRKIPCKIAITSHKQ